MHSTDQPGKLRTYCPNIYTVVFALMKNAFQANEFRLYVFLMESNHSNVNFAPTVQNSYLPFARACFLTSSFWQSGTQSNGNFDLLLLHTLTNHKTAKKFQLVCYFVIGWNSSRGQKISSDLLSGRLSSASILVWNSMSNLMQNYRTFMYYLEAKTLKWKEVRFLNGCWD